MKYLPLLIANLKRKKVRSFLTIASFAVALFLYGLLATIDYAFYQSIDMAGIDRLVIRNKTSLIMPLPVAYNERIKQMEGIEIVSYASWFGGIYQDLKNFFPQFALEPETYLAIYPEFVVPEDQWRDFLADRQGCIVGHKTAEKFNWKIGQRIPLQGTIYGGTWEFNLRGIYHGKRKTDDVTQFWFHHTYLDENTPYEKGYVGWYMVKIDSSDNAERISKAIDQRFENSPFETTTETERAFATGFVKQFGNIKLIILSVGSVVFFTLLLITGSNISLSVRERTNEIAVLKTLGFSDQIVLLIILAESVTYALIGGLIGLGLCKLFTLGGDPTGGMIPVFYLAPATIVSGCLLTIAIGIAAGAIPAILAMRLKIVDAMRRA